MSLTTAKICALLLSGAIIGSGSTVAVKKKVSPTAATAAKGTQPGVLKTSRSRVVRPEPAPPPAAKILDCAIIGSPFAAEPLQLTSLPPLTQADSGAPGFGPLLPGAGGGGVAPPPPPTILPGVPEPDAWALSIIGFGLVGASMRRREGLKV